MTYNLFVTADHKPSGLRAKNINTIDEVPDSNWFTNRIGTTPITPEQMTRGANVGAPPDPSKWILTREKTAGVHPGFTARDAKGETWFLEFDPPYYAEGATGAVAVASRIFWALGYNQVELFLTHLRSEEGRVRSEGHAFVARTGTRTRFNRDDMNAILERVAKKPDGTYRVVAGRLLPGKVLGGYLFQGTRPDDPNDVVPHEHRRELRALRVFGAWTNLTDLKAANTLDTLVYRERPHGRQALPAGRGLDVRHVQRAVRMGSQLRALLSGRHDAEASVLLRLRAEPVADHPLQGVLPVGRRSSKATNSIPKKWRPQTPTTAYMETRDDDAFWAARRIAAFSDELIRAAVNAGQFSDPKAEKYLGDVLIKRRDKILSALSHGRQPDRQSTPRRVGRLTFENAAIAAGVAKGQPTYRASWMLFDNATGDDETALDDREPDDDARGSGWTADGAGQLHSGGYLGGSRGVPDVEAADQDPLPPDGAGLEAGRTRAAAGDGSAQRRRCRALNRNSRPKGPAYRELKPEPGPLNRNQCDRRLPERDLLAGRLEHRDLTVVASRRRACRAGC